MVIRKGREDMELLKRKVPAAKWDFKNAMDYRYPELSFDVGQPFKRESNVKNPSEDPWMKGHLEREGMATPKRFMDQEG